MRLMSFLILLSMASAHAQATAPIAFDVATIRAVEPQPKIGRFLRMENPHRFVARNMPLQLLIAAAYNLNPKAILGGPAWVDSAKFDIEAVTPGATQPTRDQQMLMLASLLSERFQLAFHREQKEMPIYVLSLVKGGPKLKKNSASAIDPSSVLSTVYPDHILMPARNAGLSDFVAVLQRAILDRPVVDHTGLTGRYDFDLNWAPSEREFGGEIPTPADSSSPPLVIALQEQLGLKLEATHGPAEVLVIDHAVQPAEN